MGSFVAGLFISAAGVRTLEGLLQTGAKNVPHNPFLFPVDVILTAALIAGGSNALAFLVQTAKDKLAVSQDVTVTPTAKQGGKDGQEAPEQPVRTHPLKYLRARLTTAG